MSMRKRTRVEREAFVLAHIAAVPNGCWEWHGARDTNGYGIYGSHPQYLAHRMAYEIFNGPIPAGLHIDHLCRNPSCVHPLHIEVVTPRENTVRGNSPHGSNARKTHCKHGHEFTAENTYRYRGDRLCRTCISMAKRRHNERLKLERVVARTRDTA